MRDTEAHPRRGDTRIGEVDDRAVPRSCARRPGLPRPLVVRGGDRSPGLPLPRSGGVGPGARRPERRSAYRAVIAAALRQWRRFAALVGAGDEIVVIDGCFFGYLTWSLFPLDVSEAEILADLAEVERIVAPLNPALIAFRQADVAARSCGSARRGKARVTPPRGKQQGLTTGDRSGDAGLRREERHEHKELIRCKILARHRHCVTSKKLGHACGRPAGARRPPPGRSASQRSAALLPTPRRAAYPVNRGESERIESSISATARIRPPCVIVAPASPFG